MHQLQRRKTFLKLVLILLSCGLMLGFIFQGNIGKIARASGETVSVWLTTPDQANLLSSQPSLTFGSVGSNSTTITVNDSQTYQQMVGFGASLTDSSAWLIYNKMSQSQRNQLMTALFSPSNGIGLDFLRQPMGSSDMALPAGYEGTSAPGEYTYDDVPAGQTDPNLSHFSISHDTTYIIPLLQQALQLNSNLKIMATPWTAPAWMKSNDSLQQGSLNTSAYQAYAQYFVDFIKAYQAQGVPIYAVTPQNEPENNNVMPTMPISASAETTFIANDLGPALAQNGLSTQLLGYDHNWDDPSYPTTILSNATAASYTPGIAWHCYAGNASAMTTFHNSYPSKGIYETECSGGTWQGSTWPNGFQDTMELAINDARNWSQTVVLWNMALDPNGNPNLGTANSCTTCRGVVTIDQNTGNVAYNSDYYGLGQFSKFVVPGAYYVSSNSFGSGNIEDAAFKNPDGSDVLVVYNGGGSQTFQVEWNNEAFSYTLPAGAAVTFKWSGNGSTATPTPTPANGSYDYILNLHSGLALDDTNGGTTSGTLVQQWAQTNGDTNQEWSLISTGNGSYSIINLHSGLALADPNGSTTNGTQVQLITPNSGDASQQWSLVAADSTHYYLVNKASGLALDDTNGSTSNGTIMQVWAQGNGNANQEWSLVSTSGGTATPTPTPTATSTPTPTPTATSGGHDYIMNLHSGLVLDDTNGSTSNGTLVQQWAQTSGDANQEWTLVSTGNGYYYIVNLHSGLALDDTNGSTSNGAQVQLWTQTSGDANQEWSLVSAGNGNYYIINLHSGLALDDTNGSTSNGTIMQLWTQTSSDANQEWSLVAA